ncbi:T9SS type A sorting domain-containing protein, partial [candidate division TA06 bacterium]
ATGTADEVRPDEFVLLQNEPNPFHATTTVRLMAPDYGSINLSIYDCSGRLVNEVADEARPGVARLVWDGRDASGHLVPTGMYFYRLRVETSNGAYVATRKMALLR